MLTCYFRIRSEEELESQLDRESTLSWNDAIIFMTIIHLIRNHACKNINDIITTATLQFRPDAAI